MVTWGNLFSGYDAYSDVFGAYPHIYTDASNSGSAFEMYKQFIINLPYDLRLTTEIFFSSVVALVILSTLFFVFIMPILRRPQRW